MSTLPFFLLLFSGLMHALYNFLIKRSRNKSVFIWWMFAASTTLLTLSLPLLPGTVQPPDTAVIVLAAGGAACFVIYHLLTGSAYGRGDLSVTYPISQTGIIYVPLWGVWLLSERLTIPGVCGIVLVAAGAWIIQLRRLTPMELLRPVGSLFDESVLKAGAAGFIYSLGAIIDKTSLQLYPPLDFTYFLVVFMLAFMTLNLLRPCNRSQVLEEWRANRRIILAGAPLMMGSFLSFRYGLALVPMSYAVPVRHVSVPLGVMLGIAVLGESCGRARMFAALLIVAGVSLIRLG